ncbi:hypothetical protein NMY22_g15573 [Coprinellus aureogranulatus]|nr:hypothetical protein NMY22_g15573 [Coprinellus aureogranulatus]
MDDPWIGKGQSVSYPTPYPIRDPRIYPLKTSPNTSKSALSAGVTVTKVQIWRGAVRAHDPEELAPLRSHTRRIEAPYALSNSAAHRTRRSLKFHGKDDEPWPRVRGGSGQHCSVYLEHGSYPLVPFGPSPAVLDLILLRNSICSQVTVGKYLETKSFARELVLTKVVVVLITLTSTLQAAFAFLCYYDFLSRRSPEESSNITRWAMVAPASFITVYLTTFLGQTFACFRIWNLTKVPWKSRCLLIHRFIIAVTSLTALVALGAGMCECQWSMPLKCVDQGRISHWRTKVDASPSVTEKTESLLYTNANNIMRAAVAIQSSTVFASEVLSGLSFCVLFSDKRRSLSRQNPLRKFIDKVVSMALRKMVVVCSFTMLGLLLFFIQPATHVYALDIAPESLYSIGDVLNARMVYGQIISGLPSAEHRMEHGPYESLIVGAGMYGMRPIPIPLPSPFSSLTSIESTTPAGTPRSTLTLRTASSHDVEDDIGLSTAKLPSPSSALPIRPVGCLSARPSTTG